MMISARPVSPILQCPVHAWCLLLLKLISNRGRKWFNWKRKRGKIMHATNCKTIDRNLLFSEVENDPQIKPWFLFISGRNSAKLWQKNKRSFLFRILEIQNHGQPLRGFACLLCCLKVFYDRELFLVFLLVKQRIKPREILTLRVTHT